MRRGWGCGQGPNLIRRSARNEGVKTACQTYQAHRCAHQSHEAVIRDGGGGGQEVVCCGEVHYREQADQSWGVEQRHSCGRPSVTDGESEWGEFQAETIEARGKCVSLAVPTRRSVVA